MTHCGKGLRVMRRRECSNKRDKKIVDMLGDKLRDLCRCSTETGLSYIICQYGMTHD